MSTPAPAVNGFDHKGLDHRTLVNQANAALSTGPRTDEGKANSAKNSFQHGLSGLTFALLPNEDRQVFENLVNNLLAEYQPQTSIEQSLVEKLAQHQWLSQRAVNFQAAAYNDDGTINDRRLSLALRYLTTHERLVRDTLAELTRVQQERRKQAARAHAVNLHNGMIPTKNGFVSKEQYLADMKARVEAELDAEEAALSRKTGRR